MITHHHYFPGKLHTLQKNFSADATITDQETINYIKGTVQRKLTWVKSGIYRKLVIWAWAAWGLFYILRGLGP
jgi:hypothetical protein